MKTIDLVSIVSHTLILGSVGNITVEEEGTNNVTISWSELESDAEGYLVEWKTISEDDVSNKTVDGNKTTIGGLEPGTEYFISVAACTSSCVDTGEKSNTTARTCKFRRKFMLRLKEKIREIPEITWNFI